MAWSCWYTCPFQMDGCDHTMSCYMWSFSLLDGCNHTLVSLWSFLLDGCTHSLDPFTSSFFGWLCPYHDSCTIQSFSVMYMYICLLTSSPTTDSSSPHALGKHFTPLIRPSCFRGLHNMLSLSLNSPSTILEDLYSVPDMLSYHEETPIVSLFMRRTIPFWSFPKVYPSLQDRR